MNQAIKDAIYSNGTAQHVDYLSTIGGMCALEKQVLTMIHDGKTDLCIQSELHMTKGTYNRIEDGVRRKLLVAVFHCIDYTMQNE